MITEKYKETRDWIIGALIEKIEGHVDRMDDGRLTVNIDPKTGLEVWYWNKRRILECVLKQMTHSDNCGNETQEIIGHFSVPMNLNDEYIEARVMNWTQ